MTRLGRRVHRRWWFGGLAVLLTVGGIILWGVWPRLFPNLVARGESAYRRGDWAKASGLARERLEAVKNDPEALRLLARSSARLGRDESAAALFARLDTRAMKAEDHHLLGIALNRVGKGAEALQAWQAALKEDPDHPETLDELVRLYFLNRRPDEAARAAERLSRQPGWEARGELMLGVIRAEINDPAGSAEAIRRALARDPEALAHSQDPPKLRKMMARNLLQIGEPAEARGHLMTVLASGPDREASWLLSRAYLQEGAKEEAAEALVEAGAYRADHPMRMEPSPYVGEARCAKCHPSTHHAAMGSRHSQTFSRGPQLDELPLPDGPVPDPDNPEIVHEIRREGGRIRAETRIEDRLFRTLVDYAFGTSDRYVTMVGHDDQGASRALRLSYYHTPSGSGWDRTSGDTARPERREDFLGRRIDERDGVIRCLYCHTTNPRSGRIRTGPESADRAIGCERCHGPGGHHVAAIETMFADPAIVSPATASTEGLTRMCNDCHILDHSFDQKPRTDPSWVRSQGLGTTWSRCYTESLGAFHCLTCHDPHRDAETSPAHYEARCLSCHAAQASPRTTTAAVGSSTEPVEADAPPARVTCPVNPIDQCLSCHMPKVKNPALHLSLTDHYIRVREGESPKRVRKKDPPGH